jgi:aryl-alcohol dehydrogenase-like predicted oxidoreductase
MSNINLGTQGFGAMGLTAFYGPAVQNDHGIQVMKSAFDAGCRMFDTAQIYQQFIPEIPENTCRTNEELVGMFAKEIGRENITIATKFFPRREGFRSGPYQYSWELLLKETEASLTKLGIDCIDLYYLHRMYPENVVTPEAFAADMKRLVELGKIKGYGLSEASSEQIRRAHSVHPLTAVQQEWSLFARDLEADIVPTCKELGINIVAYSPIARGMLGGALTEQPKDWRATIPYLSAENIEANRALVAKIEEIAKSKNTTPAQISLAWVIKKGGIPIPGTTKIERAKTNHESTLLELSNDEMSILEAATEGVKGLRGDEGYMSSTFHRGVFNDASVSANENKK